MLAILLKRVIFGIIASVFLFISNTAISISITISDNCKSPGFYDVCSDPSKYEAYRWRVCVKNDPDATLFKPSILVYEDILIGCVGYVTKMKLDGNGECAWAGVNRYCARLTEKQEHGNNYACPSCVHNSNGDPIKDEACPNCRCNCDQRVCAFHDKEGGANVEGFDQYEPDEGKSEEDYRYCCIDPPTTSRYMPYHKDTPNPCCGKKNSSCSLWGYDPCGEPGVSDGKYINGMATNVGCVDIPMGPYPPPLCDPMQGVTPAVSNFNICQYSPEYELDFLSSSDDNNAANYKQTSKPCDDNSNDCSSVCEYSTLTGKPSENIRYNTFERPLVRLYFDNQLSLCPNGYVPPNGLVNDSCVEIYADSNYTPSKIWTDNKNLIPGCDPNAADKPPNCVYFYSNARKPYNNGPSGGSNVVGFSNYTYFRPYYKVFNVDSITNTDTKPYADYSAKYPSATISLAGVYDTYYADMGHKNEVEMIDYTSLTRKFLSYLNIENGDGRELCIDEDVNGDIVPVGCYDRPKMFPPVVHECVTDSSCGYNSGEILYNNPRISYDVGRSYTDVDGSSIVPKNGIIGINIPDNSAPTAYCIVDDNTTNGNASDNPTNCTVYNAKLFSAYLTDDVNYSISYDTDEDGSGTQDSLGTVTPYSNGEAYSGGMQFVDYAYCRGATKICLTGYDDANRKVIAKIVNGSPSNLLTDRVIPPYTKGQTKLLDEELYNPEKHDWYDDATGSVTEVVYGYKVKVSDEVYNYYEYPECTSGTGEGDILCEVNSSVATYPTDDITCRCGSSTGSTYECTPESCTSAFEKVIANTGSVFRGYKYGNTKYNSSEYGKRALNSMELGQCVEAAQPYCNAILEDLNSSTISNNGYASWDQTNAGITVTGTCVDGTMKDEDSNGNPLDPTRSCLFIDSKNANGTAVLEANGCPSYTVSWGAVTNPCVTLPYPTWWPSQFLAGVTKMQGAIFNQFNVAYNYEDNFVPASANYNPFDTDIISTSTNNRNTWIEDWYNTNTYNSCKYYDNLSMNTTTAVARNSTNGDQEMLYLTKAHWERFWNTNDMTWLLDDKESNNGCIVYEFSDDNGSNRLQINANYPKSGSNQMSIGMKVCKYASKISFSLVDMKKNSSKGCANNAYIMQSNIIAYDQYVTQNEVGTGRDESFVPKTAVSNILFSNIGGTCNGYDCTQSAYRHYMYHGIVIDKNGFDENDYVKEVEKNSPPIGFQQCSNAEDVKAEFLFSAQYRYESDGEKSKKYKVYTYNPDNIGASCSSPGNNDSIGESHYDEISKPTYATKTCALDAYREGINYSSSSISISSYLPNPDDITSSAWNGENINWGDDEFDDNDSYISKMYQYTCYNGSHKTNWWPQEHDCRMDIRLSNYVSGNSARNKHMFVWRGTTSYDVCNN